MRAGTAGLSLPARACRWQSPGSEEWYLSLRRANGLSLFAVRREPKAAAKIFQHWRYRRIGPLGESRLAYVASPSPRPSPLGRGRIHRRRVANRTPCVVRASRGRIAERTVRVGTRSELRKTQHGGSLSLRERVRVR